MVTSCFIIYTISLLCSDACGAEPRAGFYITDWNFDNSNETAFETIALTSTEASSYQDYTYQIILHYDPDFEESSSTNINPDTTHPVLQVFYNGAVIQTISVPQGSTNPYQKSAYFFGCFIPFNGGGYFINNSYYDTSLLDAELGTVPAGNDAVSGSLILGSAGLCTAVLNA